jgi:hypothetical protein
MDQGSSFIWSIQPLLVNMEKHLSCRILVSLEIARNRDVQETEGLIPVYQACADYADARPGQEQKRLPAVLYLEQEEKR